MYEYSSDGASGDVWRMRRDGAARREPVFVGSRFHGADLARMSLTPRQDAGAFCVENASGSTLFLSQLPMTSSKWLADPVRDVVSAEWSSDGKNVVFSQLGADKRPSHVYILAVGDARGPRLLYEEQDTRFVVDVQRSKNGRFLMVNSNTPTTSKVHERVSLRDLSDTVF